MTESFEYKEAALPNIKGTAQLYSTYANHTGALYRLNVSILTGNHDAGIVPYPYQVGFDASLYNNIYNDNCTTVQPASYTVMYIIKIK